jgi:hypothetical protein
VSPALSFRNRLISSDAQVLVYPLHSNLTEFLRNDETVCVFVLDLMNALTQEYFFPQYTIFPSSVTLPTTTETPVEVCTGAKRRNCFLATTTTAALTTIIIIRSMRWYQETQLCSSYYNFHYRISNDHRGTC